MSVPETYFSLVRREPFIVAYWRLNDPAGSTEAVDYGARYDLIGIYSSLSSSGPALIQADTGAASSIFSGDSVLVGDAAPLQLISDMSIECWVAPYTASQSCAFVSKYDPTGNHPNPYFLGLGSGQIIFELGNGATSVGVVVSTPLTVSIPSHIVATVFRGEMTVYLNGVVVGTGSVGSQTVTDGAQPLYIGELRTGVYEFNGLISEVAIYNGALSARRIARHFAVGQQVLSDPAHYRTVDPPAVLI